MLIAYDITKSYNDKLVLGPLDLVCRKGDTTILLGQSGCGKSTLLRLFMGLLLADSGTISIHGTPLNPMNARFLRQQMGYVTQDGGLFPHLTALDNILLASRYFKRESEARTQLDHLLDMTKLERDLLSRFPAQLSGGQRQRVSLVRALALNPDYVLLDEPMAALDPMIRAELQLDLKTIFKKLQKTVVMVTHDVSEAAFLGDQIVMLHSGRIVQQGTFTALVHKAETPFVTNFLMAQRPIAWPDARSLEVV